MVDPEDIKARAHAAKALLEDKAYQYATLELRKRWFGEWTATGGEGKESVKLCAQIVALESVAAELQVQINDYKMHMVKRA